MLSSIHKELLQANPANTETHILFPPSSTSRMHVTLPVLPFLFAGNFCNLWKTSVIIQEQTKNFLPHRNYTIGTVVPASPGVTITHTSATLNNRTDPEKSKPTDCGGCQRTSEQTGKR